MPSKILCMHMHMHTCMCYVHGDCGVDALESFRRMLPTTSSFELRKFMPGYRAFIGLLTVFFVRLAPGGHAWCESGSVCHLSEWEVRILEVL